MKIEFSYGRQPIILDVPRNSIIYRSKYEPSSYSPTEILLKSLENPIGCIPLGQLLDKRTKGNVVIVVSDFTRPIQYTEFLPKLIAYLLRYGVNKEGITILIATGMHRPSTITEKQEMFGQWITKHIRIIDHNAEEKEELVTLTKRSWSGRPVKLNKHYFKAGFRILTGLVEPHFMAGFSGGRKAICPGLTSIDAIRNFHGYGFLDHPSATNGVLLDNPCHLEATSIAKICPADFLINIVLDEKKKTNRMFSGDPFLSYSEAVEYVKERSCVEVNETTDIAITSCGGYPLDNTFYQCVKGFVNCLPALKKTAEIVAFGCCSEGIGSPEYQKLMRTYSGNHQRFIDDLKLTDFFIKDQWQFQMHLRALKRHDVSHLHFYTSGITKEELSTLSVTPYTGSEKFITESIQKRINIIKIRGERIALFPEGPYCSPVPKNI